MFKEKNTHFPGFQLIILIYKDLESFEMKRPDFA